MWDDLHIQWDDLQATWNGRRLRMVDPVPDGDDEEEILLAMLVICYVLDTPC